MDVTCWSRFPYAGHSSLWMVVPHTTSFCMIGDSVCLCLCSTIKYLLSTTQVPLTTWCYIRLNAKGPQCDIYSSDCFCVSWTSESSDNSFLGLSLRRRRPQLALHFPRSNASSIFMHSPTPTLKCDGELAYYIGHLDPCMWRNDLSSKLDTDRLGMTFSCISNCNTPPAAHSLDVFSNHFSHFTTTLTASW